MINAVCVYRFVLFVLNYYFCVIQTAESDGTFSAQEILNDWLTKNGMNARRKIVTQSSRHQRGHVPSVCNLPCELVAILCHILFFIMS